MTERKEYTAEEIRAAINDEEPQAAFVMAVTLFQRFVVAIEEIAAQGRPKPMLATSPQSPEEYKRAYFGDGKTDAVA
jgi:hypothetical protein